MFEPTKKVSTYLTFALALPAFAQNMPSFTANCGENQVKTPFIEDPRHPRVDLNGGYATDRDCKQIFVLPPTRGRFLVAALAPNDTLQLCKTFDAASDRLTQVDGIIAATIDKMKHVDDPSQLEALNQKIDVMDGIQKNTIKSLEKMSQRSGLFAQVQFENQWEAVIRAYKEANPDKTVIRMPLIGAYLSATLEYPSALSEVAKIGTFSALKSAKVPGLSMVPEILSFTGTESRHFTLSSSLSGQIELSQVGACPYWNALMKASHRNKVDFGEVVSGQRALNPSLAPYLVANLQYFYPLETSFRYKMNYDTKVIAKHFAELVKTKSTFDAKEIEDELVTIESKENMGVVIENGIGTDDTFQEQIQGLTQDLRIDLIQALLSKIATPKEPAQFRDVPLPTDPHRIAFGEEYVCHTSKSWFRTRKKCYSRSYTLKIPMEAVAAAVEEMAMDVTMDINKEIKVYKTFIMGGSLGFVE